MRCRGAARHYDLAINFEGDIRTHLLPWLAGARRRVGFAVGGGGPLLTDVVGHDGGRHVAANSLALVERAFDLPAGALPDERSPEGLRNSRLVIPESARSAARAALTQAAGGQLPESLLAVHVPAGRAIKQWPAARFADAASVLAADMRAAVVLTGTPDDRALVDEAAAAIQARGVTVLGLEGGVDLVVLAGLLSLVATAADRRYGTDASGCGRGHAGAGRLRAVDAMALCAAGRAAPHRASRSAVQPVQSNPPATGTLPRPRARLPRSGDDGSCHCGGAGAARQFFTWRRGINPANTRP